LVIGLNISVFATWKEWDVNYLGVPGKHPQDSLPSGRCAGQLQTLRNIGGFLPEAKPFFPILLMQSDLFDRSYASYGVLV
jgi:hypothetical protein